MCEKIVNAFIKLYEGCKCAINRSKIKCKDFSVISNNCWGGFVYQMFGFEYTSPTIGLFIMESDYIKFVSDLNVYLLKPLEFIRPEDSRFYNKLTNDGQNPISYPVARLDDVDIFFMHYHSEEEAREKWQRRCKRINFDRLIVKISERNDCNEEIIDAFCKLPFKNKLCFTQKKYENHECCVFVNGFEEANKSGIDETELTLKSINIFNFINNCL